MARRNSPASEKLVAVAKEEKSEVKDSSESEGNLNVFIYHFDEDSDINRSLVADIQDGLRKFSNGESKVTIWIESPGGDAHSAYKLMLELRNRFDCICGVVPDYAKSAATLLLLGADKIYMAPAAELGPLDVQIPHPDRENVQISGLDSARAISQLANQAVDMVLASGPHLLKYTGLTRTEVLHEGLSFMADFLRPAVGKLDPHLIHNAVNQLKVAERYARMLLSSRNESQTKILGSGQIASMLRKMVNDYPAHGFIISRNEAKSMGLPIEDALEHPMWDAGFKIHSWARSKRIDVIGVFDDNQVKEMADQIED